MSQVQRDADQIGDDQPRSRTMGFDIRRALSVYLVRQARCPVAGGVFQHPSIVKRWQIGVELRIGEHGLQRSRTLITGLFTAFKVDTGIGWWALTIAVRLPARRTGNVPDPLTLLAVLDPALDDLNTIQL